MHVPVAFQKLVDYAPWESINLTKVRLFVSGSSYCPPSLWKKFHSRYNAKILERYGSSETGIICSNLYEQRIPGCAGKPLPGVKMEFLGGKIKGEIAVKSPGIFLGYYMNNKANEEKFTKDGFVKTGDIGVLKNGRIYLRGRIQEKIKKSGYTIYPRDVEWVINRNPKIIDSYVLGKQTKSVNDEIIYFICKKKITKKGIMRYCEKNMPKYWLPDKVIFLKEIPRTRSGKPKITTLLQTVT
jgi:malonyl-CoA/methylmalonyl-CoA synthetase